MKQTKIPAVNSFDITKNGIDNEAVHHWASAQGELKIIYFLVERGVDLTSTASDESGKAALHVAAGHGHCDIIAVLLQLGSDTSWKDKRGNMAMHYGAAFGRYLQAVQFLIQHGVDLLAKNEAGFTALSIATSYGEVDIMQLLLDNGAHIEASCVEGRTTLHYAAERGHEEAV